MSQMISIDRQIHFFEWFNFSREPKKKIFLFFFLTFLWPILLLCSLELSISGHSTWSRLFFVMGVLNIALCFWLLDDGHTKCADVLRRKRHRDRYGYEPYDPVI